LAKVSDATGSLTITELARSSTLSKSLLTSDDVFIVNTGLGQVFAWVGKNASEKERKMGLQIAVNYVKENKLGSIGVSRVVEGGEPSEFLQVFV
jgi:Gelsolin repeat